MEMSLLVQPQDLLVVGAGKRRAKHVVDAPIAESAALVGDGDHLLGQLPGAFVDHRRMPVTVSGEPHKPAGAAFGQVAFRQHPPDRRPLGLWG